MKTLMCTLLVCISANHAVGQNFRDSKSQEFRFDEYKLFSSPLYPNFSQDSTWLKPESRLPGIRRQGFESDKNYFPRNGYTKYNPLPDHARREMYSPFDRMPCLKPYGLYRMNVLEPDMSLYNMPVK